jgi:acyl carrier protein
MIEAAKITNHIKTVLHERFDIEWRQLTDDACLKDIGLDSMHLVDILLDIEAETGKALLSLSLSNNPSISELACCIYAGLQTPTRPATASCKDA